MKKKYNKELIINEKKSYKKIIIPLAIICLILASLLITKSFYKIDYNNWYEKYKNEITDMDTKVTYYKIENKTVIPCEKDDMDLAILLSKKPLDNNRYSYKLSYLWNSSPIKFEKYQISIVDSSNLNIDTIKRKILMNENYEILDKDNKNFYIPSGSKELIFSNLYSEGITKGVYTSDILSFESSSTDFNITYEFKLEDRKNSYKVKIPGF